MTHRTEGAWRSLEEFAIPYFQTNTEKTEILSGHESYVMITREADLKAVHITMDTNVLKSGEVKQTIPKSRRSNPEDY